MFFPSSFSLSRAGILQVQVGGILLRVVVYARMIGCGECVVEKALSFPV